MKQNTIKATLILITGMLLLGFLLFCGCDKTHSQHIPSYYDATEELPDSVHAAHAQWVDEQLSKWDSNSTSVTVIVEDGYIIFYQDELNQFKIRPDEFHLFETWFNSILPEDINATTYINVLGLPEIAVHSYITGNYGYSGLVMTDRTMCIAKLSYDVFNLCKLSNRRVFEYDTIQDE